MNQQISEEIKEYITFKINQFIRLRNINTKGMDRKELAELTRPFLKQWLAEALESGRK